MTPFVPYPPLSYRTCSGLVAYDARQVRIFFCGVELATEDVDFLAL